MSGARGGARRGDRGGARGGARRGARRGARGGVARPLHTQIDKGERNEVRRKSRSHG